MNTSSTRPWLVLALLGALAGAAHAESLEQRFRGYLDRLRAAGQQFSGGALAGLAETTKPEYHERTDKLPLGTGEYAIFVSPLCRSCDRAVADMRAQKLHFTVLDVSRNTTAREAYETLNTKALPVILMPSQMMTGYDAKLFNEAMRRDIQKAMQSAN